jgi:phosphate transport system substrate-binding protein
MGDVGCSGTGPLPAGGSKTPYRGKDMKTWAVGALVVLGLVTMAAQAAEKTLQLEGSTTVGPIAEGFAEAMMAADKDLKITVKKTGSGDGIAALLDKRCDIATASRFLKDKEFASAVEKGVMPVVHTIAMDGVCMIVHPSNRVCELGIEQIRKIYSGETTNWKDLGGPDAPIVVISRETSSGTYEVFNEKVMNNGKTKIVATAEYVASNPQVYNRVKATEGSIGYVGLGFVDDKVAALKVNGIMPTTKTIAVGAYPISRPLFLVTNGYPELGSLIHAFCTYYLTEKGQEIIQAKGFIPVTNY